MKPSKQKWPLSKLLDFQVGNQPNNWLHLFFFSFTMTTTFSWAIANLERHTNSGIVYTAHWVVNATTESGAEGSAGGTAGAYGSIGLEAPAEGDTIIPYADLTQEIVVGWVKEKLGEEQVTSTEAALATQIADQLAPKTAAGLPW